MNRLPVSTSRLAIGLLALGGVGLAVAQNAGSVEPRGQGLQASDVRAKELRSILKAQAPAADDAQPVSRRLSAQEREAMRMQLREQGRDVLKPPANDKPGKP